MADLTKQGPNYFLNLSGIIRAGVYGTYDPDTDETYDVVRMLKVARYQPERKAVYVRLGPLQRMRLGSGSLVNFLNTDAAWDDRTVGLEAKLGDRWTSLEVFSEDLFSVGLIGGRFSVNPFWDSQSILSTLKLGVTVVSDRKERLALTNSMDGQEMDVRIEAYRTGGFSFYPFASFARIPEYGQGFAFGADLENENFIDLARVHFRLALHYNSSDFRTGYFGSFYTVSSHRANVLSADESIPAGVALRDIDRGNSIETELRILIFRRFEFWYAFMRYHGVQPLSEYHLRLMFTSSRFNLSIGQDRRGLVGFTSLFDGLGDENRMKFEFEYRFFGPLWVNIRADYTYSRLYESVTGIPQYIVQRRFSPLLILRYPELGRR